MAKHALNFFSSELMDKKRFTAPDGIITINSPISIYIPNDFKKLSINSSYKSTPYRHQSPKIFNNSS